MLLPFGDDPVGVVDVAAEQVLEGFVAVEPAAPLAQLRQPGPDGVGFGVDRDRPGRCEIRGGQKVIAGEPHIDLCVAGAPPQRLSSQQRRAHAGEPRSRSRRGEQLRAFGQRLRDRDKEHPGHQRDAGPAWEDLGAQHRDAEAEPGDHHDRAVDVIHGCRAPAQRAVVAGRVSSAYTTVPVKYT